MPLCEWASVIYLLVRLITPSIMSFRSIHIVTNERISSCRDAQCFPIDLSGVMHLSQLHILASRKNATVDMGMQVSLPHTEFISFGKYLDVRWLCSTEATVFSFPRSCHSIFHNGYTKILTNSAHWLLDSSLYLCLFGDCCSSRVRLGLLVVWIYSPDGSWDWALLPTRVGHLHALFCKVVINVIYPPLT